MSSSVLCWVVLCRFVPVALQLLPEKHLERHCRVGDHIYTVSVNYARFRSLSRTTQHPKPPEDIFMEREGGSARKHFVLVGHPPTTRFFPLLLLLLLLFK